MTLTDFTRSTLLVPGLEARNMPDAIHQLASLLMQAGFIEDAERFSARVLERESLASTTWESGFALPHARIASLKQPWFAMATCLHPIAWGDTGSTPIRFVVLIAVPESDASSYLTLLSGIARLSSQSGLKNDLQNCRHGSEMLGVLNQIQIPSGRKAGSAE